MKKKFTQSKAWDLTKLMFWPIVMTVLGFIFLFSSETP